MAGNVVKFFIGVLSMRLAFSEDTAETERNQTELGGEG